jgi:hypothetical protein
LSLVTFLRVLGTLRLFLDPTCLSCILPAQKIQKIFSSAAVPTPVPSPPVIGELSRSPSEVVGDLTTSLLAALHLPAAAPLQAVPAPVPASPVIGEPSPPPSEVVGDLTVSLLAGVPQLQLPGAQLARYRQAASAVGLDIDAHGKVYAPVSGVVEEAVKQSLTSFHPSPPPPHAVLKLFKDELSATNMVTSWLIATYYTTEDSLLNVYGKNLGRIGQSRTDCQLSFNVTRSVQVKVNI